MILSILLACSSVGEILSRKINGKPVSSVRDVSDEIGLEVGQRIKFTINRKVTNNTDKFVLYTDIAQQEGDFRSVEIVKV